MSYATRLLLVVASVSSLEKVARQIERLFDEHREAIEKTILEFMLSEVSPESTFDFEQTLAEKLRELGRQLMERVLNLLEADDPQQMPHDIHYQSGGYRRLNQKTRNAHVATLFGTIELWRHGYRYWQRDTGEATIFPLEIQLGLLEGATAALAEAAGRYLAEGGATQQTVLDRLKSQHAVRWGPERLRRVAQQLSASMDQRMQEFQVLRLLELLNTAQISKGRRRPVLSAGRDGVTLREYRHRLFQQATAATISVYDRSGKRLGTVYLAFAPELGQQQMTTRLTSLLREVLLRWEGPLPRLVYVTDAGENETQYYRQVLRNMTHPRTGERLHWFRIVDYYHTAQRIWTMAEALFGKDDAAGRAWARRMCKLLKQPNGPSRVLHSAAAFRAPLRFSKIQAAAYRKAYNYIRRRTKIMQYHAYQKLHLPIGSGVTEAACKTVFAQRLKLSGMRWTKQGAQTVLNLRVTLLSGIWDPVYRDLLRSQQAHEPRASDHCSYATYHLAA